MPRTRKFCTFTLDGLLFGLDVEKVEEVIRPQEMTPVPLAPAAVKGLINLRGRIIIAIDLRSRLELPRAPDGRPSMIVVTETEDGTVSFLVDEIGSVLEVSDEVFERPPSTLRGVARDLIRGAYKLEDRLLLVLDAEKSSRIDTGVPVAQAHGGSLAAYSRPHSG